jgi:polyisoprenyl-phosphate glycosyltransferase
MHSLKLSVIIPCFNEEEVIQTTYDRVKKVLESSFINHEIIFVNDGSKDKTIDLLTSFAESDINVKVLSFSRNFGHQPAVTAGITHCTGDMAIIMDADLQDPPELIPDMVKTLLDENCNVVYGVRKNRKGETFFKKITAKIYYKLINYMSDVDLPKDTGDFRLIDKKVIDEFRKLHEKNKYIRGLISWIGFKQCPFYYEREPRLSGETKYSFSKMIKFASTGLIYFTKKPLAISITLGFLSILIGLFLAVYVIIAKITEPAEVVPGWASTLIIIIFFGGIQLLSIGVLGRYIACVFDEVKNRPEYIVDKSINF